MTINGTISVTSLTGRALLNAGSSVTVGGTTWQVSFVSGEGLRFSLGEGSTATAAQAQDLLRAISYRHNGAASTTTDGARVLTVSAQDAVGNITAILGTGANNRFRYDGLDRLTHADNTSNVTQRAYPVDKTGNRTGKQTAANGAITPYVCAATNHRLAQAGTEARTRLHGDLMAARHVLAYRRGRQADAVFVLLDFLGDADTHGLLLSRLYGNIAITQIAFQHLADFTARQLVDLDHVKHALVLAQPLVQPLLHGDTIQRRGGDHEGDGRFPPLLGRHTHNGTIFDGGMGLQHLFDIDGIDVEAARNDHVLGAVEQGQEAVLVKAADVAGADETLNLRAEPFDAARGVRQLVITRHHGG
jgi:hypothetical protein